MNISAGKIDDLAICVDDHEDSRFETEEPCDLIEITAKGIFGRLRSPAGTRMAEVKCGDRPEPQNPKHGLRSSPEAGSVVRVKTSDRDEKVACGHLPRNEDRCSEGCPPDVHEVAVAVVNAYPTRTHEVSAHFLGGGFSARWSVRSGSDEDCDVPSRYAGVRELAHEKR